MRSAPQGRIRGITGADRNIVQKNAYDRAGRLVRQTDGMDTGIEYVYNIAGDRVHFQTTGGATQELVYDAQGNITGVVDGNHNHTRYELDDWGRIAGIVKPDGSTESYLYDHAGNMTSSTDGEGNTTLYGYDLAGNVVSITDPTGEKELFAYDKEGRVAEKTDRNGITTQYAFNMYGAPLYRRVKDGIQGESYQYTPEGLMKAAISAGMHYSYEYDVMGRITRKSASGRTLLAYGYDLNGNLTTQRDVTGKVTEYTYNALDLIEKVTDNGTVTAEYGYYPDGSIRSLKNGNLYTEYAFDADKNLTGLKTTLGTEVLADNHYAYDPNGNRTEKRQISGTTRYTYDALNQLNKVQYPSYAEELYYDRVGNRTRRTAKGVEELYKYDPRNRLTEYTKEGVTTQFTYDNAGNLLKDDKAKYTYDAFNRTEKVETFDGHVQINRYDAEGLRHEMEEDGRLVQFIFRGDEVIAEEKDSSVIRYIRGYDLIASDAESARTYYHYASDEMSSITHIVGAEQILNHYEYDAWGNATVCEETVENRFRFNGQQYDPITQQYYLRARFYNPVIARFTQEDTYRGDGLNLYAYCRNNPVYYIDPSGHMPACMKEVYDQAIVDGKSKAEAYKLAKEAYWKNQATEVANARRKAEQKALQEMNILHKPISKWSDDELQRAVDSIHNAKFNGSWFGELTPMAVTVDQGGRVVVTKNKGPIHSNSPEGKMAIKIFGPDVEFPIGYGSNYPKVNGDSKNRHAEARGIQAFIHGDINIVYGQDEVRQACSHYSCGGINPNWGCAGKITQHNVTSITGFAQNHNGRIKRQYVSNLWYL